MSSCLGALLEEDYITRQIMDSDNIEKESTLEAVYNVVAESSSSSFEDDRQVQRMFSRLFKEYERQEEEEALKKASKNIKDQSQESKKSAVTKKEDKHCHKRKILTRKVTPLNLEMAEDNENIKPPESDDPVVSDTSEETVRRQSVKEILAIFECGPKANAVTSSLMTSPQPKEVAIVRPVERSPSPQVKPLTTQVFPVSLKDRKRFWEGLASQVSEPEISSKILKRNRSATVGYTNNQISNNVISPSPMSPHLGASSPSLAIVKEVSPAQVGKPEISEIRHASNQGPSSVEHSGLRRGESITERTDSQAASSGFLYDELDDLLKSPYSQGDHSDWITNPSYNCQDRSLIGTARICGVVGKDNSFIVNSLPGLSLSRLSIEIQSPVPESINSISITHVGESEYRIRFRVSSPGYYVIAVKVNDQQMSQKNFVCQVVDTC